MISDIAIRQKDKQIGAKRLIILSASLSDSEMEAGEPKGRGATSPKLVFFALFVILFKLFLDCYSMILVPNHTIDKMKMQNDLKLVQ